MKLSKYLIYIFSILILSNSCDNPEEPDTTPPNVSIISHQDGESVSEFTTIQVEATDNDKVVQVRFAINGIFEFDDFEKPWEYEWNTTNYSDSSIIELRVVAYDESDNETISNIVNVFIDNSLSYPQAVNVVSVNYDFESMTIRWEQSIDEDFFKYRVFYADTNIVEDALYLATISSIDDTMYSINNFDPTEENWYWIEVVDQYNLSAMGEGMSNTIEQEPEEISIITVFYDSDALIIEWETSNELDFESYTLNHRENDTADWEIIFSSNEITDSTYQTNIDDFPADNIHWFNIAVTDIWGLSSTSVEANNSDINGPPLPIDILSVTYNTDEMTVTWEPSFDNDFVHYILYYSDSEVGSQTATAIDTISENSVTNWSTETFNPTIENWFWVGVEDTYGALALGDGMSNQIESAPEAVDVISVNYEINPENMYITWEQSGTNNFAYYTLYHAESQFESIDSIDVIPEIISTTYSLPFGDFDPTVENWFWVKVTNIWGLSSQLGTGLSNALDLSPQAVNVTNITYTLPPQERMYIFWNQSYDTDFQSYQLLHSESENGQYSEVAGYIVSFIEDTFTYLVDFDPTIENWFKIQTSDIWGQTSIGNGQSNEIDPPPEQSTLYPIEYDGNNNVYQISWEENSEEDFKEYLLYESQNEDMSGGQIINGPYINDQSQTYYEREFPNEGYSYYQLVVRDLWNQTSFSNIEIASSHLKFIQTYGGSNYDFSFSIIALDDGFVIAATSTSFSGTADIWIIKTDIEGNIIWNQVIGDEGEDRTGESDRSLSRTSDGGFILTGISDENGSRDALLIKLDSEGILDWQQTYGGNDDDRGLAVVQTIDGGYLLTGQKSIDDLHYIWLIKTNNNGDLTWEKFYGGGIYDSGYSVLETTDGEYIITGNIDIPGHSTDIWIGKTDIEGNLFWADTLGGISFDLSHSIQETNDGNYIIVGSTYSMGSGGYDAYVIKINSEGYVLWDNTYGGNYDDKGYSIVESIDGMTFTFCGQSNSYGSTSFDAWIVQIDSEGNELYNYTVGGNNTEKTYGINLVEDGGFIITGETSSIGLGGSDILLIKTDSQGNTIPFID